MDLLMVDNTKNCIVMEEEEMEAKDSDIDESKENEEKAIQRRS